MICTECLNRNYVLPKKKNATERLELMKFCPHCGKHTLHKESK